MTEQYKFNNLPGSMYLVHINRQQHCMYAVYVYIAHNMYVTTMDKYSLLLDIHVHMADI